MIQFDSNIFPQTKGAYITGGSIRDLLLGRTPSDYDIAVLENPAKFAGRMAADTKGRLVTIGKPGKMITRIITDAAVFDISPVYGTSIEHDLFQRDFTINAMAVRLNPGRYGSLVDLYGGRDDLERGLIGILHEKSFTDDATRIWRALRYEQRLDFLIERDTGKLLKRDINKLTTISGTRLRHELELLLAEELPEKVLKRAGELGVLRTLHPAIKGDNWLAETFTLAGEGYSPDPPPPVLYLALLTYRLTEKDTEQQISYLKFPKSTARVLRDTQAIKGILGELAVPGLAPSRIYALLHGRSTLSLMAGLLVTESTAAAENIELYLDVLKSVRPLLTGQDILRLGVPEGPRVRKALLMLREARLDGKTATRRDEETMLKKWWLNHK